MNSHSSFLFNMPCLRRGCLIDYRNIWIYRIDEIMACTSAKCTPALSGPRDFKSVDDDGVVIRGVLHCALMQCEGLEAALRHLI